jgi:phenylacetate-CoA ligase
VSNAESGLDILRLFIEPKQGVDVDALRQGIRADVLKSFEVAAEIMFLDRGTIGREFEASIKAARFVDRRG